MKKYVIIGVSAAGVGCATKLRELDQTAQIIMIGSDEKLPCNRCLISEILSGEKTKQDALSKDLNFFESQNIKVMLNTTVTNVFPKEKTVLLASGEKITYDKLFLGTGKSGFIPQITGANLKGVFTFYGLPDIEAIVNFINKNAVKKAVVVGAGLTGLECADALSTRGISVDVIEKSTHILPAQIDQAGAEFIQKLMAKNGIQLFTEQSVEKIIGDVSGKVSEVLLSKNKKILADMIIFATGGKINLQLAACAKLNPTPTGIITSSTMQTSNPDIFAGGDCCMVNNLLTGMPVQSCLWPDAKMQGMTAAHGMVGIHKEYPGILIITSSNIFGTQFVTCGPVNQSNPGYEEAVKIGHDFYHKFLTQDNILKGFIMVGKVENVGLLRKKLIDKTTLQPLLQQSLLDLSK